MSGLRLKLTCDGARGFRLQLDCSLPDSGVSAIYGPSGSGKSTLLDCIAGLRHPAAGSLIQFRDTTWLDAGHSSPVWQRRIGYVFQDARLLPHLDGRGNLQYALDRRAIDDGISLEKVIAWLDLEPVLSQRPASLSAGQRQRIAIARALLSAPRLLLLDEPLANLDKASRHKCLACLRQVAAELALPMIYVSHDIEEVSQLADHLLLMEAGQVREQGSLLELCNSLDASISREEQAAAIVIARIDSHQPDFGLSELELAGQPLWVNHLPGATGQPRRVRIAARDVSVCRERPRDTSILNILAVTLDEVSASDEARVMLRLDLGGQFLLARITRKSAALLNLRKGDRLFAQIKSAALLSEEIDQP